MFLYPTLCLFSTATASWLCLSSFSEVSGSPGTPPSLGGVAECDRDVAVEAVGDAERVVGAFTTTESVVDATVERDVVEEVRSADAASRERGADDSEAVELGLEPCAALLLLILAARAFNEGRRLAGLEASAGGGGAGVELELMIVVWNKGRSATIGYINLMTEICLLQVIHKLTEVL